MRRDRCYLDDRGRQTDAQAAMLAFVGAVMKGGHITGVNVLRIGERDYRHSWEPGRRGSGKRGSLLL
jgi:hypothetical protein